MGRTLLLAVAAAIVVGGAAQAHHSYALYFEDQTVSIEGELVEFEYRAPHAWVRVMAPDEKGMLQQFSAEWANPSRLTQLGVTKETLKPGDRVVVTGSPGRNGAERRIHLKSIRRPADGWAWAGRGGQR